MSAVAHRAGVGQASLYRRYPSKEALLARVCRNGMERMQRAALSALESPDDLWEALSRFLYWYLESGTPRLAGLLGSFTPAEDLFELARDTNQAIAALVERNVCAGRLRSDVTGADLTLIVTELSRLTAPDPDRAPVLRRRYLTLLLDGMAQLDRPSSPDPLPTPKSSSARGSRLEAGQPLDAEPGKSTLSARSPQLRPVRFEAARCGRRRACRP
jgi:AcrR family transcriptional regulator